MFCARFVTYGTARRRRFAAMPGAQRLFAECGVSREERMNEIDSTSR